MSRKKMKPRFRLRKLRITNIDRVEAGANPGARALIYKSADMHEELGAPELTDVEWLGVDENPELIEKDGELVYVERGELQSLSKATTKRENDQDFPAAAFAYVPDPEKSSTWKLRLWNTLESKETRAQVGAALAALSPGGFRGQRVQIPAADLAGVKRKIMTAWLKTHPDETRADAPAVLKTSDDSGVETMSEIPFEDDLHPDVVAYINEIQGELDSAVAVTAELDALRSENPEVLADLLGMELVAKSEEQEEEEIFKGASPELVDRIQKAETDLAAMRHREERARFVEIAKSDLGGLAEPSDAVGEVLHTVAETMGEDSDSYKLIERVLKAASATAVQSADVLFNESGTSQGAFNGSAEAELHAKVEQVMKSKEVDFAAGLLEVRSEDPELFRIYEQERADRARG